jgi:hypothetical protein
MGHISMPWDGDAGLGGIGDCGPYSSEEWSHYLANMVLLDPNYGGVFWSYLATNPSACVVRLSNGAGIVRGRIVETDSYTDFTPSTPVANTRKDRIVLRSDYTAQTIRPVYRENSVEGADYETLQQTAGVLWEVAPVEGADHHGRGDHPDRRPRARPARDGHTQHCVGHPLGGHEPRRRRHILRHRRAGLHDPRPLQTQRSPCT